MSLITPQIPTGQFRQAHAINPYDYQPVNPEVARVIEPGGYLFVTGTPKNPFAQPVSPQEAAAAGFEYVATMPRMVIGHNYGQQRFLTGKPLNTVNSRTHVYQRVR